VNRHYTVPWTYTIVDKNNEKIEGKLYEQEMVKSKFDFDNNLLDISNQMVMYQSNHRLFYLLLVYQN
jgi:hypothetical protein